MIKLWAIAVLMPHWMFYAKGFGSWMLKWLCVESFLRVKHANEFTPSCKIRSWQTCPLIDFKSVSLHFVIQVWICSALWPSKSNAQTWSVTGVFSPVWPRGLIFITEQNFLERNLRVDYYLLLKYCRRQCALVTPTCTKLLKKLSTKMQDLIRVLDLNCQ